MWFLMTIITKFNNMLKSVAKFIAMLNLHPIHMFLQYGSISNIKNFVYILQSRIAKLFKYCIILQCHLQNMPVCA